VGRINYQEDIGGDLRRIPEVFLSTNGCSLKDSKKMKTISNMANHVA
jgi:hypothetical protein